MKYVAFAMFFSGLGYIAALKLHNIDHLEDNAVRFAVQSYFLGCRFPKTMREEACRKGASEFESEVVSIMRNKIWSKP